MNVQELESNNSVGDDGDISIALVTEIECDAYDIQNHFIASHVDDTDSIECNQCGEEHSTREWFKETIENIIDNATSLEERLRVQ